MSLSTPKIAIEETDSYDFTVHCSPIYSNALVSPENAWANFVQKIHYANKFIEGFEDKGYSKVNLGSHIYDIDRHRTLIDSCTTHLEETYSDCLREFEATDSSVDLSIITEAMLPESAKTDFDNLLGYDTLMIEAVNYLKQKSNQVNPDYDLINTTKDTPILTKLKNAISNPIETVKKATPMAVAGSLLFLSGFAYAFDSDHHIASDSADTLYQDLLHQLSSLLDLSDIYPDLFSILSKLSAGTTAGNSLQ